MDIVNVTVYALIFCFGLIIGSFLNVVIYRIGSGTGYTGRSKCLSCGKTLKAKMLVPLFSFLFQKGKCGFCGTKLSLQYPIVEFSTGALFVLSAFVNHLFFGTITEQSFLFFFIDAIIFALLVLITVYDFKHKIIPDTLSFLFAGLALLLLCIKMYFDISPLQNVPLFDSLPWWIDFATGPLLFLPFAFLWFFSGGRAMGLGDAKLSLGIGWFLGFSGGISAIIFGFWIAFFPSIILLFLRGKHFTMKSEIPFAPFLIAGTLVVYAFGINIFEWTL